MKTVAMVAVALVLVVGVGLYAAGCSREEAKPPLTGPVPPTGPVAPPVPPVEGAFTYVCPEHADQTSPTPAKCPTCQKPMKADTTEPVEYFCPMHPEVVQSEPGECQKCEGGMVLQARAVGSAPEPAGDTKDASVAPPGDEEKSAEPSETEKGDSGTT